MRTLVNIVAELLCVTFVNTDVMGGGRYTNEELWRLWQISGKEYRPRPQNWRDLEPPPYEGHNLQSARDARIRAKTQIMEGARPFYYNGTPYTDEQLAESNKTRYNASGKQQVQRHVTSWRSPLQRHENQPGTYSTGYLGPLPNGPIDGPYCPTGFDCFYHYPDDPYRRQPIRRRDDSSSYYRRFRP
jgi:hypothetical protein